MPIGVAVLIVGTIIGIVVGWVVADDWAVGAAAGFAVALILLIVSSWLDRRQDKEPG